MIDLEKLKQQIEAGIREAFDSFSNEQIKELVMQPYKELREGVVSDGIIDL